MHGKVAIAETLTMATRGRKPFRLIRLNLVYFLVRLLLFRKFFVHSLEDACVA